MAKVIEGDLAKILFKKLTKEELSLLVDAYDEGWFEDEMHGHILPRDAENIPEKYSQEKEEKEEVLKRMVNPDKLPAHSQMYLPHYINIHGSTELPYATQWNLELFELEYAIECTVNAIKKAEGMDMPIAERTLIALKDQRREQE